MEHRAPSRVFGDASRACVELESAAFGGNGDPQRVAREQQLAGRPFLSRCFASSTRFTGSINLDDALARRESARRGDFFHERFDVGTEKLVRAIAGFADEMKMSWMSVGMLEAEAAFTEIDFPRDSGLDHPLQRPIHGRAADAMVFAFDQID